MCKTSTRAKTYHLKACDFLVSGQIFNIERCRNCDFLFTNPRPNKVEISKYYQSPDYISHTDESRGIQSYLYQRIKQHMLKTKLKLLKKHTNRAEKKLLDYGCGTGDFVLAAQNKGYTSKGLEPDKKARERAKQKGLDVIMNDNDLLSNNSHTFDVITLWHVLEHLHELEEKMQLFNKLLKPRSTLVIALPMANSADAALYGEYWAALDVPRHLYHFTPETFESLCKTNGFEVKQRKGLYFDSFYISLLSEKNKRTKAAPIWAMLRGLDSNIKAWQKKHPWSSEIFVCKKQTRC